LDKQKAAVILDAAQEMQHNDEWWLEFEWMRKTLCDIWTVCCEEINPLSKILDSGYQFRRKAKTITVTMPVPENLHTHNYLDNALGITFKTDADREAALAAIRQAVEGK
jgi:hypothetical protein